MARKEERKEDFILKLTPVFSQDIPFYLENTKWVGCVILTSIKADKKALLLLPAKPTFQVHVKARFFLSPTALTQISPAFSLLPLLPSVKTGKVDSGNHSISRQQRRRRRRRVIVMITWIFLLFPKPYAIKCFCSSSFLHESIFFASPAVIEKLLFLKSELFRREMRRDSTLGKTIEMMNHRGTSMSALLRH